MPTYEYICPGCGHKEQHSCKMTETLNVLCHTCFTKGDLITMNRGPGGGIAVHFKGTGFYETDYKGKK